MQAAWTNQDRDFAVARNNNRTLKDKTGNGTEEAERQTERSKTADEVKVKHISERTGETETSWSSEQLRPRRVFESASEGLNVWAFQPPDRSHYRPHVYTLTDPNRLQISFPRTSAARGEEHLNQIDFTDVNYEDTDIMHKVIYPSEEFK